MLKTRKKKRKIVSVIINGGLFSERVAATVIYYQTCQVEKYGFVKSFFFRHPIFGCS